ncbi:ankyrin repeat [Anaeramoeba ignava]|uniref:Ankyrin repeat n=1 Tax=Anaeramoeba ignava TaxID=1746090 RepID=A0A9Q0LHN4_ANAIG|nr:ankyrin repeat [Anaeramoeba ignava]
MNKNEIQQLKLNRKLILACQENSIENVKLLIENGSNIHFKAAKGKNPLHFACQNQKQNSFEIIKYLISKKADVNAQTNKGEETPLHFAIQFQKNKENSFQIIKYLIENGADVNVKNKRKETPLHFAIQYQSQNKENSFEIIKYLIDKGSDVNAKNITNKTPLYLLFQYKNENAFEIIKYCVEKYPNLNFENETRKLLVPVCKFQNQNSIKIVKYLIEKGFDINAKIGFYETPLYLALQNRNLKLIQLLMMNDVNIYDLSQFEIIQGVHEIFKFNQMILSNFKFIKQFLLLRFDNDETILQKFIDICSQKSKEYVQIALNFLYTGFTNFDDLMNIFHIITDLQEKFKKNKPNKKNDKVFWHRYYKLELVQNWIEIKKGRKGIIKDLSKLYKENETKDFKIIFDNEKEIKVHKLILIIRSELFKGMFQLNVEDKSNQVHDYSGKSFQTIYQLIHFIYHDKFSKNIKKEKEIILEEYFDLKDYYQLNQNSIIDLFLKERKLKLNFQKIIFSFSKIIKNE